MQQPSTMDTADGGRGKANTSSYSIQNPPGHAAPPSSSQMFFGERPPEARGTRNKIFSANGMNRPPATNDAEHPLYKSAQLAKVSNKDNERIKLKEEAGTNSNAIAGDISGSGTNFEEFYSPRPPNNDGCGELKTSQSGSAEKLGLMSGDERPIGNGQLFS